MASMRVHELAKEFDMTSKDLLDRLHEMKIPAKSHASMLADAYVDKIRKNLEPEIKQRAGKLEDEEAAKLAAEQREAEKARAAEKLVTNLLPVIDDFERTIDYAANNGEAGLLDGVKAVHSKLVNTLTSGGVEVIDPKGDAFDALEAQAVATVDDASVPDETVAEVYQKGYKMGSKVLRPAMVTVTSGGPKREKAPDEGTKDKK